MLRQVKESSKLALRALALLLASVLLCLSIRPELLSAQEAPSFSAHATDSSLVIDGRLDEKAWQEAEKVSGFRQFEPNEGAPASQKTEVRVLHGANNAYIGAILYDDNPSGIRQILTRRDSYNQADWFLVSIDSYFDQKTAYTFGVNAAGVQYDALTKDDGRNPSWDAVWESAVQETTDGWNVELRIPYSMLRFPDAESQTWGIHFIRRIPRLGEQSEWPLIPRTERSNLIANYGRMVGVVGIEPGLNLQIRPYSVARLRTEEADENPGVVATDHSMDMGGDVEVGLGPNITLNATINPDFGQVESDPAVLNLTAFETFFDEKRPFFVEGMQNYEFEISGGNMFYSRRIGAQAPIIGATKLSGRTEGDLSFGVLGATTGSNLAPSRNYGVARLSQQVGNYSSAGGILTAFEGSGTGETDASRSLSGGADWDIRFNGTRFGFEGYTAFTHRRGTTSDRHSMTGFSSMLEFTKREGVWSGKGNVKVTSDTFDPNDLGQLSRDRINFVEAYSQIRHDINNGRPFGTFQRANAQMSTGQTFSYDEGLSRRQFLILGTDWTMKNFHQFSLGGRVFNLFESYDLYETRGLGLWNEPGTVQISGSYATDERKDWEVNSSLKYTIHEDGGHDYSLSLGGTWNVGDQVFLSGNLSGEWENGVTAWVANETFRRANQGWMISNESLPPSELDAGDFSSFDDEGKLKSIFSEMSSHLEDQYYVSVFGSRDTRSVDFTLRGTVAFTPDLSLQTYSQLFLAKGHYRDFAVLQNRDTLAPFDAYPKQSGFTLNSLRSNLVLRWEYRPGSRIYLVWNHSREERSDLDSFASKEPSLEHSLEKEISQTFSIFPQETFMLKLDHTFLF